ncbi:MAG: hypothetical protein E7442_02965 [Ruminococcaceae bacterium]|nr:hypothetical protein [Oscillospiraceae bacterium]
MKDKLTRKRLFLAAGLLLLLLLSLLLIRCGNGGKNIPTLRVETPQKLSRSQTEAFILDVSISHLGEALYPAMSTSIRFDPACLEFLGVEEGNVFVTDAETGKTLPQWSCNPEQCNKTGLINVMYLDLTGGRAAFSQNLLAEEDNVVMRLSFRLRGSARSGDVYDLLVEDAVFAASEESQSLAMTKDTLKCKNGKIVVGD